jgi:O-antigen/teichoic acid export membrane protein
MGLVSGFGFDKYLFAKIPGRNREEGFSIFTSVLFFELFTGLLILGAITPIGILLIKKYAIDVSVKVLYLSILLLFFTVLVKEILRFHGLRKRLEAKSVMGLLQSRLWVVWLWVWWYIGMSISLERVLFFQLISMIFVFTISFLMLKKRKETLGSNNLVNKKFIKSGLLFGAPLLVIGLGDHLLNSADRYIIGVFLSTTDVGLYSLAYGLIKIAYGLVASVIWVFSPYFAETYNLGKTNQQYFRKSRNIFNISLKICLAISFFICLIVVQYRHLFIILVSSSSYLQASSVVAILSIFPILLILIYLFSQVLMLEEEKNVLIKGYIIASALNIGLNFLLIPNYGIDGAAFTTLVSYLLLSLYFFKKIIKYKVIKVQLQTFVKLAIILFFSSLPFYFSPFLIEKKIISLGVSSVMYVFGLFLFGVFEKNDFMVKY